MQIGNVRPAKSHLAIGILLGAGLLVYCVARYGDAVMGFFFLDDFWLLQTAQSIDRASTLLVIFQPTQAGFALYRPLTQSAYFFVLHKLFGLDASGYHAVQLSIFAVNATLVLAIARQLTTSWARSIAAGIFYAAAPGHAAAVYWLAAFTMIGTAAVVFVAILWWLCTSGWTRALGCAALQLLALLCSEHAVILPMLLVAVSRYGAREKTRSVVRAVTPTAIVAAAYLGLKAIYFARSGTPQCGYAIHLDLAAWLVNVGRYAVATLNIATLAAPQRIAAAVVGALVLFSAVASAFMAARRSTWRMVSLGLNVFVVALLPILPLTDHYYDYYVGIAALGTALTIVGMCDVVTVRGDVLAGALALAVVAVDLFTCDAAVVQNPTVRAIIEGQEAASDLVRSIDATRSRVGPKTEIVVPRSPVTDSVIDVGRAHTVFFTPPALLSVTGGKTHASVFVDPGSRAVPLYGAPPGEPPFWWNSSLSGLRAHLAQPAQWYWSTCEYFRGNASDQP